MFKSILLPIDGSELSDKVTATAIQFATLNHARIVAVTVVQPMPLAPLGDGSVMIDAGDYSNEMQEAARGHIDKVAAAASAAGIPFDGLISMSASPSEEIVEAANKYNCDIILMGSHGRTGLEKLLLGSETQKVLSHTTIPVLVLR
ncbi:universal stress protein [Duganella aceris]|jgi:nucleotide-binding universal stress UspA family protein|uniref:Universal stress protein n=1 Tax=Duganella aceris TaxID=2703883 RepID=A0ABX0FQ03_9BURK|nr:universal stress protein [Duganella aceris]NGZ86711.1 universal stress protein [Duganella aceris]